MGNNQSQQIVEKFCAHCSIIEIDEPKIIAVLQKHTNDFEDQIQLQCALSKKNIKYLITRNVKDFKTDAITVLSPDDFLKLYEKI